MESQVLAYNSPLYGRRTAQIRLKQITFKYYKEFFSSRSDNELIELDILEKEVPVTEDNPKKSKKGLYKIKDNYIRFWFAFVYPNISFIEAGNSSIVLEKIKNNFIDNHVSYVYEDVCREKMWQLNADKVWPFYFSKVGRYWNSKTEIDICALDPEGKNIIVGECKYWKDKMCVNVEVIVRNVNCAIMCVSNEPCQIKE